MAISQDLDWLPFALEDGQSLALEVDWGEGGVGRAEVTLAVYDAEGALVRQDHADGSSRLEGGPSLADDALWLGIDGEQGYAGGFTWSADEGLLSLDEPLLAAAGGGEGAAPEAGALEASELFAGGEIVYGGGLPIGDVRIGGTGHETYRITAESEGETVTILDFHPGAGGDVLDISDLLATGSGTIEVAYDSLSASTTLTLSSAGMGDTVIIVHGVDLTINIDAYVVTDTIL